MHLKILKYFDFTSNWSDAVKDEITTVFVKQPLGFPRSNNIRLWSYSVKKKNQRELIRKYMHPV